MVRPAGGSSTIDGVTLVSHDAEPLQSSPDRQGQFRYGVVFVLTLVLVVFVIAAPSGTLSRALALALDGAALVVAVATARVREEIRLRNALLVTAGMLVVIVLVVAGVASEELTVIVAAVVTAAVPVSISSGVVRLLREQGVTIQAVAGALAIYLSIGLLFAWVIGFIGHVDSAYYFAQHTNGTESQRVYFSFTVLTTTGFGDLSAATRAGRALAVIEMLVGQLYLVTVIGLLIGGFASRQGRPASRTAP